MYNITTLPFQEGSLLPENKPPRKINIDKNIKGGKPPVSSSMLTKIGSNDYKNKSVDPSFTRHYKHINFDTLKERHDNFSFEKAIETKQQVYDTLHFQGLH